MIPAKYSYEERVKQVELVRQHLGGVQTEEGLQSHLFGLSCMRDYIDAELSALCVTAEREVDVARLHLLIYSLRDLHRALQYFETYYYTETKK